MQKRTKNILIAIFLITLTIRLILAFTTPNLTYDSYFHLRQVQEVTEHGFPSYQDDLSYGGKELKFLPFFHYFMAFFNIFLPIILVAKILPNILLASLTIIVFLISYKITENEDSALFSAAIAGFLPTLFSTNSFGPLTLFLPLVFLNIYAFMNIKQSANLYVYLVTFLLLSLTSSATFLLIIGFSIYILLSYAEGKRFNRSEIELIIFSLFFFVWLQFIFFKDIFLSQGIGFIWQNVPTKIISQYFPQVSIFDALLAISIIPFLAGIFVVYRSLFELKGLKSFLLISLAISTTLLAWFKLIEFNLALSFFGIILAILFSMFYQETINYIKDTKLAHLKKYFITTTILLLLFSTVYPAVITALQQNTPTDEEIDAFSWLAANTAEDSTVMALLEEGHLVTYYGKRKNVMDSQFGLVKDVDERLAALQSLHKTPFQTQALSLADKYNIRYLTLTPTAKNKYDIERFNYLTEDCFELVHNQGSTIYKVRCALS